jgi:hypothetical protein
MGQTPRASARGIGVFLLVSLVSSWLLLLNYISEACAILSLSRSISPAERKDSSLHNETQNAMPADFDFVPRFHTLIPRHNRILAGLLFFFQIVILSFSLIFFL